MDGKFLAGLGQIFAEAVQKETNLIGVMTHGDICEIHIRPEGMKDFAPLSEWILNAPREQSEKFQVYPYEHYMTMGDVKIFAITEDSLPETQPEASDEA